MQVLFIAAYTLILATGLGLSWLNLRHQRAAGGRVPEELAGAVEPERLDRIAPYSREREQFAMIYRAASGVGFAVFLLGGVLGAYDRLLGRLLPSFVWGGAAFFTGLALLGALLELPFGFYRNFRLEVRHGFNRMSVGLFFADWLKGTLLSLVFTLAVSVAGLELIVVAPNTWWLWVWMLLVALSLAMTYAAPYVIEPLFHKMEPLGQPELEAGVRGLAERVGVELGRVLKVDASRRSGHSNAYFTGLGRVKRVVLFDTLLAQMTYPEILAVLAHELGHWKKHHVLSRTLLSFGVSFFALCGAFWLVSGDWVPGLVGLTAASFPARVVILAALGSLVSFPLTPLAAAWSRRHEWQADRFAVELWGRPGDLASALAKLARENLSNLHPHPLYATFYYTHPPVVERIRALRTSATLGYS
jgi:STE24 endopeptidase